MGIHLGPSTSHLPRVIPWGYCFPNNPSHSGRSVLNSVWNIFKYILLRLHISDSVWEKLCSQFTVLRPTVDLFNRLVTPTKTRWLICCSIACTVWRCLRVFFLIKWKQSIISNGLIHHSVWILLKRGNEQHFLLKLPDSKLVQQGMCLKKKKKKN